MQPRMTAEEEVLLLAAGSPKGAGAAGDHIMDAREVGIPSAQGRRRGRAIAAGAIALCLAAAALVATGASAVPGKAALSSKTELTAREDKHKAKHKAAVPDMGTGFAKGTFWPTLFCWSVMNINNANEVNTIKLQLKHRIGIFACDNVAVLSAQRVLLGKGHELENGTKIDVYTWKNPAEQAPIGNLAGGDNTNSFKNTGIFINAWNILVKSGALWGHDWTVKVDPDAVFFAERLRWHLKKHTYGKTPFYFKNCNFKGPQLYGALEVFNEAAMKAYKAKAWQCRNLPWGGWGEDEWIDKCMMSIGGQQQIDYALVGDHRCMSAECEDTWRAAFHDYKTPHLYLNCYNRSINAEKWKRKQKKITAKYKAMGAHCCTSSWKPADKCGSCQAQVYPGQGFCGASLSNCRQCGAQTSWCGKGGKELDF